eukprot:67954_4
MVKTRFQINKGEKMRIIPTMRAIVAEGGVRQLYRGGLPEIAGLVPRSSAMWSGYEMGRRKLIQLNGGVCTTPIVAAAGACGGICEGVAFQPFQIVKVRLMAKEHLGRYKNTFDCVAKIVRSEGVAALSIGLGPTLWRNCVWDSVYLSGVYNLDKVVPKPENVALQLMHNMVQGTLMGMFATCFNAPFDVCKSRFQAQLPGDPNPYSSTFGALCRIAAEEGLQVRCHLELVCGICVSPSVCVQPLPVRVLCVAEHHPHFPHPLAPLLSPLPMERIMTDIAGAVQGLRAQGDPTRCGPDHRPHSLSGAAAQRARRECLASLDSRANACMASSCREIGGILWHDLTLYLDLDLRQHGMFCQRHRDGIIIYRDGIIMQRAPSSTGFRSCCIVLPITDKTRERIHKVEDYSNIKSSL